MAISISAGLSLATTFDVYLGTYTNTGVSKGIYHAVLNTETGDFSTPELACELGKPSFLAIHPNNKFIYSVTEGDPGKVRALRVLPDTGKLELVNQTPSGGKGPCHLIVSSNGRNLYVANYLSGSVASIAINDDGSLGDTVSVIQHEGRGPNQDRQSGPHAHSVNLSPDNKFAYVADLGLDKIMIYKVDPKTGALTANDPAFFKTRAGAGPRHLTFHPNGKFVYFINELDNTVVATQYDEKSGALTEIQTISTLPEGYKGKTHTAEVKVHPNGKFLYGSNRGHDSIAIFAIDEKNGALKLLGFQGEGIDEPRNFNIDPTGAWCVVGNQDTDDVALFKVDSKTGLLEPTGLKRSVGKPICVKFIERK